VSRAARLKGALLSAGGAVSVQFVLAGGSLVLQGISARTLGGSGYGTYALLYGLLVLVISVQTSWLGDALTVFDRFDPRIRGALLISLIVGLVLGVTVAVGVAAWFVPATTLPVFALLTALWILNESGRRIFTARMEFWRLAANDAANYAVTLLVLCGLALLGHRLSLALVFASMCAGMTAAIGLAWLRQPSEEYTLAPLRGSAIREVLGFSGWRSIQAGVRPLALLLARVLVAAFASRAALGAIEAARLLLAPALTVANGSGWFFLGDFAKAQKAGTPLRARHAVKASLTLGGVTLVIALAALALAGPLGPVLTGGEFPVDGVALGGWALYTVVFAATLPLSSLATARKRSRLVFVIRAVEMSLGLLVLVALLAVDAGWAAAAPYCLSGGGVLSLVVLWAMLRRADPPVAAAPLLAPAGSGQQESAVT
jgi:O-antigen/teichoic acid export membrane protein